MSRRAAPVRDVTMPIFRGSAGNGPLSLWIKESFLLKLFLELIECKLQSAKAYRLKHLHDQLVLSTSFIRCDPTPRPEGLSVLRPKAEQPRSVSEANRRELSLVVLQSEVEVAGG